MSFRCTDCKQPQPHGEKPRRRVIEKRQKDYPGGGRGWEIVKEGQLCDPCDIRRR